MKGIAIRALVPTLSAFFAALAFYLPQPSPVVAEGQKVQVVEVIAKKYEYSPSPVHLKSGTKIQLNIQPPTTIMVSRFRLFLTAPYRMAPLD
jgi:hypothetical protein